MELFRHPCGLFYSRQFADFLLEKQQTEGPDHQGELLALDYIRCREGLQAGNAWWQLDWVSLHTIPADARVRLGEAEVALSRKTLHGLNGQLLHFADGQVVVKK